MLVATSGWLLAARTAALRVNLSVDKGSLTLGQTNGLVFLAGDGDNDSSMTIIGTADNINAALDGLQFMPAADVSGDYTLTITTDNLASLVAGGAKTTTNTVAIDVSVPTEYSGLLATRCEEKLMPSACEPSRRVVS